jgi:hypothetical protein
MVAAMAAMILAVVLGVGHVVGDMFFHNCQQFSAQLRGGGACVAPEAPAAGDDGNAGHAPAAPVGSAGQGGAGADPQAPGTNDLGSSSDDM